MNTNTVKFLARRRSTNSLVTALGLLWLGLLVMMPLDAVAAPIYMDDFEDGDTMGWQETIVSGSGGSGSTGVGLHNGSQMAFVYHRGRGQHLLSQDFDYIGENMLSFDMHAVATAGKNLYGNTLHSRTGVKLSFLNFLNVSLGSISLVNATNQGALGPDSLYVDDAQHAYSGLMSDFAASAGLGGTDPIKKISLAFFATGDYWSGGGIYPSGYSSGTVWFDNVRIDPVPIPSALWLFGSGLIGLVGLTRRKKLG